jgi:hypothetical protein
VALTVVLFSGLSVADSVGVKLDSKTLSSPTVPGTNIVAAPYYLDVTSVNNDTLFKVNQQLTVICDDYNHDVQVNETWTADVLSLSAVINGTASAPVWVNSPPASAPPTTAQYEEVAWLMEQTGLWGAPTFQDQTGAANNIPNINEAIWDIMSFSGGSHPAGWTIGAGNNSSASWEADALANYKSPGSTGFYNYVEILTPEAGSQSPLNDGPPQQYLTVVTPEPATLLLFGTGLIGVFQSRKRRRVRGKD